MNTSQAQTSSQPTVPQVGMVAAVRNRRGVVSSVRVQDGQHRGALHLVEVAYNDGEIPVEETLLWEREPGARLIAPTALPDPLAGEPMEHADLDALVRACRWTAHTPFVDPDAEGPVQRLPVTAPFHGAIQVEDYQLYPLLKALRMPRVSLLIADDVGIGKTIETGLILAELLLRRRIRRVLILTPAALRIQWRDELWNKFSLPFDIVDRDSTAKLRRQLGMDANPWRSSSRIITSYHYLKQADVLTEFIAASQAESGGAHLPWDLLIVDEAHNLTPAPFGDESDLCKMLRQVAPLFEHRIFATATPHNGHTRSFTGLLEMLDPVRFSQTEELKPAERERVKDVLVRRLKREINARSNPKRFCDRLPPQALLLQPGVAEVRLTTAFSDFRDAIRKLMKEGTRKRRLAGNFAIEILGKRLLSCPYTFAESWHRCQTGMNEDTPVSDAEVLAAQRSVADETADDREMESCAKAASTTVGAWLKPLQAQLSAPMAAVDQALTSLKLTAEALQHNAIPAADARFDAILTLIRERLQDSGKWRDDERLVLFTEYKTTLDYLLRRLRAEWPADKDRFLSLFGGMDDAEREDIKSRFNDPASPVRVLVATDAASEGLNLQETARHLLHFDVPWNPARVEQRNGRLDRHGQARDVFTFHFVASDDQDLQFLSLVVQKVDTIREDLGATGDIFDEITYRRLIDGVPLAEISRDLDLRLAAARSKADVPRDDSVTLPPGAGEADPAADLQAIARELDFDPATLHETLDSAMAVGAGRPRVGPPDHERLSPIVQPIPAAWSGVVDDSVRLPSRGGSIGPLPRLAFDAAAFMVTRNGRAVFRPRHDALLLHLGHPLLQKGLSVLTRLRFPGATEQAVSRWSVSTAPLDPGCDALILVTVEELAVNVLRETFHHWVRTWRLPVVAGRLAAKPLPHVPACELRRSTKNIKGAALNNPAGAEPAPAPGIVNTAPPAAGPAAGASPSGAAPERSGLGGATIGFDKLGRVAGRPVTAGQVDAARDLWADIEGDVKKFIRAESLKLTRLIEKQLTADKATALDEESRRYQSRQGELSTLIETSTIQRLERELQELRLDREQGLLFNQQEAFDEIDRNLDQKQEELKRRLVHYDELRRLLAQERQRITGELIPKRFSLHSQAQLMPVAVEIILHGGAA